MEKQILDLLIKLDSRLGKIEDSVSELKEEQKLMREEISELKMDVSGLKEEQKSMRQEMVDRFDVVDIKLHVVETKVMQVSRKIDSTTDQVTRNIESIEDIRFKLQ
ncbi:MAG: hypothetical protein ACRDD7_03385 [Peptostreptococcaceae bacterium]